MNNSSDTIVALSSPLGIAGIAVIRLSGPEAIHICETLAGSQLENRYISHKLLKDPDNGLLIDDACVTIFKSSNSFTGEDCAEIHCQFSIAVIKQCLAQCIKQGARLAKKGEFTQRAFINGKLT